ncbi:uncharacterized protein K452DRAFT_298714 [Aplosporella prunicola CBS 121167]|uniref:Zn(2)-C6 fungal-type domain-containing protein n=1 Tax=Aplosporella prunicola CBS 121167 TaxID=1176127 RepID=A0A6A6BCK7_9PEZI|nr:uncharacterized protein K452DRAFT_298714 [Aplosporella prunicola CBS 121167]KAF2141328.1 hypothetical protein K452DRAFT_298714 [Aplosporella prunicola CBS 121167]
MASSSPSLMPDGQSARPKKLQRASRACDFCHKRSIRCRRSDSDEDRCQNCLDFDIACIYTRPWKRARGGVKSHSAVANAERRNSSIASHNPHPTPSDTQLSPEQPEPATYGTRVLQHASHSRAAPESAYARPLERQLSTCSTHDGMGEAWKAFAVASGPAIRSLMEIYHQIVYPIFPLFHRGTLLLKLNRREYLYDRGFFASIMAACSLVSARARDGALAPWCINPAQPDDVPSETFYAAAKDALPKELTTAYGLDYLRACALMSIASIQFGKIDKMHEYLGHYFTLSAMQRFSDEGHWPKNIAQIEREERRRLFWSIYTLDIYSSIVWNGQLHSRESHTFVNYPSEADDEQLEAAPTALIDPVCWLHGWNFTTDLYRVLEHTVNRLRSRRVSPVSSRSVHTCFPEEPFSGPAVLQSTFEKYSVLPMCFKNLPQVTGDPEKDIFGFQAANIQATLQLLRMVLFSVQEHADVDQKCQIAAELLATFQTVPIAYQKAISTPLIYHLAGIGTILGSVMESPLSEASYLKLRDMLLSMADLLENLESGLYRTQGTGRGLRAQVDRIDEYMRLQRNAVVTPSFQNTIADLTASVQQHHHQHQHHHHHHQQQNVTPFMTAAAAAAPAAPNGLHSAPAPVPPEAYHFQLPPEILEDWPWPIDMAQDYGVFPFGSSEL